MQLSPIYNQLIRQLFRHVSSVVTAFSFAVILSLFSLNSCGQNGPLKGSGKVVNREFRYSNFDKIAFLDLDGKMEIEAGKPFFISINIDDNLEKLLDITVSEGVLKVKLKDNFNNNLYIEDTKINIKICLPRVESVFHRSNGKLTVNGISGSKFSIKNTGNGLANLYGDIEELDIICRGNGTVNARNLKATSITVKRSGNGNVYTNAEKLISSESTDNGKVINNNMNMPDHSLSDQQYILKAEALKPLSTIKNACLKTVKLSVKYPVSGAYGIDIKAMGTRQEYFPIGTKIYKGNQFTLFKQPLFVISANNRNDTFVIQ